MPNVSPKSGADIWEVSVVMQCLAGTTQKMVTDRLGECKRSVTPRSLVIRLLLRQQWLVNC